MRTFLLAFFLSLVLGLFIPAVQRRARAWFHKAPQRIFLVPAVLTAVFAAVLVSRNAVSWPFLLLVAGYTLTPTVLVYVNGPGGSGHGWLDFIAILALWLPVEFTTGKALLPQRAWSLANIAAHGVAVAIALLLFLVFRDLKGMKYNLPRKATDLLYPLIGFLVAAPVLILLGLLFGFLGPLRMPDPFRAGAFGALYLKTLLGVAIPEELLFRALIQNWLMQNLGFNNRVLLLAALIFGAAHLDNPGPQPNWRYMVLATIAGFAFGKVFQKSSTILSSAGLHALVNSVRRTVFL